MGEQIVGRELELDAVAAFLSSMRDGASAIVLAGEPGIGKSTVWQAALLLAHERGYRVATSRPSESEARLSYAGLGDLLGDAVDELSPKLPPPQRHALDVALLRADGAGGAADRRAVSLATLGAMKLLASDRPVLWAIDDVQWLDRASATALAFAVRRLGDERVGVMAALREAPGLADPIGLATALRERVTRIVVEPMSLDAMAKLVRMWTGVDLPRPTLVRIHDATRGNPLFALEIVRALAREDVEIAPGEPLPLPDDLDALLCARISTLPPSTLDALLLASASTRPTLRALRATAHDSDALGLAEEAGVVSVQGDEIRFTHPLLASAVYRNAASSLRRDAHRRLAEVLGDPEERARHLALAALEPSSGVAGALEDAAHGASRRGAPATAAELAELAHRMTPDGDDEAGRRRGMKAAEYRFVAGDAVAALASAQELLQVTPPGRAAAEVRYLMSVFLWNDVTRLRPLLAAVIADLDEPSALLASAIADLGWVEILGGDLRTASARAREAIELAEGLHDPGPLSAALVTAAYAEFMLGLDVSALLTRALHLELDPEGPAAVAYSLVSARNTLGAQLLWSGDLDAARLELERHAEDLVAHGQYLPMWEGYTYRFEVESRSGNFARALELAEELLETMVEGGYEQAKETGLWARGLAEAHLGMVDEARADATEGLSVAERHDDRFHVITNRSVLGFLELSLGNHEAAERWLRPLPDLLTSRGIVEPGIYPFLPDLVETLVAVGDLDRAATVLAPFERHATELERVPALAAAARCRGLISAARGDSDAAIASLTTATQLHARTEQPFDAARTELVFGDVRRRAKQKRLAREALERAVHAFDHLGAPLWAEHARRSLARISGRSAPHGLTPTERQVADLVVAGRTNREVAEALFMSVRTVESNLSRVYAKLGITSRRQLRADVLNRSGDDRIAPSA